MIAISDVFCFSHGTYQRIGNELHAHVRLDNTEPPEYNVSLPVGFTTASYVGKKIEKDYFGFPIVHATFIVEGWTKEIRMKDSIDNQPEL